MYDASNEALTARLDELKELGIVPPFSIALYGLMAEMLAPVSAKEAVRMAFAGLLDVELKYCREMCELESRPAVTEQDLCSVAEKRRIGLLGVWEYNGTVRSEGGLPAAVRLLVSAECNFHLRRLENVIDDLERVIQLGVKHPLVSFALGYNRYVLGLQFCTNHNDEDELVVTEPLHFQVQCLQAAAAFEDGLGGDMDPELYWWIGTVLEAAGLLDAAQDAFERASASDESLIDDDIEEEHGYSYADGNSGITEEEVRRLRLSKAVMNEATNLFFP